MIHLSNYPKLIAFLPFLFAIWTIMVLVLTMTPSESLPKAQIFSYDKIGHFGMIGGWTGLLGLIVFYYKKNYNAQLLPIFFTGVLFGITIEIFQLLLPINRLFSWYDIIANSLGALVAVLVLFYLKKNIIK